MSPTELSDNLSNTSVSVLVSPTIPLDSSHSSISYLSIPVLSSDGSSLGVPPLINFISLSFIIYIQLLLSLYISSFSNN